MRGVERVTACLKPEALWSGGSKTQKEQELNALRKLAPLPSPIGSDNLAFHLKELGF